MATSSWLLLLLAAVTGDYSASEWHRRPWSFRDVAQAAYAASLGNTSANNYTGWESVLQSRI